MLLGLIGIFHQRSNKVNKVLNGWFNTVLNSVMKSYATHLQNPYKSQFSYYDTNENPFSSVSREDCFHKSLGTNCFIKYKCVNRDYEYVIRRLDNDSFDSNVECNENMLYENRFNELKKCEKICPIDCLREDYFFTSYVKFHENNNRKYHYYFWD
jgi:hypothetical protein